MDEEALYPHHLDEFRFQAHPIPEIFVEGWCGTPEYGPLEDLWVETQDRFYPCLTGLIRPDLCVPFDSLSMVRAGFAARIPAEHPQTPVRFFLRESHGWRFVFSADRAAAVDLPAGSVEPTQTGTIPWGPLISILLPVAGVTLYHLSRAAQSLLNQKFQNWELCVAFSGSSDRVANYLQSLASEDQRIRLVACEPASSATLPAVAFREAAGGFCALLRSSDELHPSALLKIAHSIHDHPNADVIYTDEQQIDRCGRAVGAVAKQAFDHEELLTRNSIGKLACIRSSAIRRAGGFHPEFGDAQEWDLLLRVADAANPADIRHVAEPLYLCRTGFEARDHALERQVVTRTLARHGIRATLREGLTPGTIRIEPPADETAGTVVFLRMEDGPQQLRMVFRTRFSPGTRFFEIGPYSVYPADPSAAGPLITLDETGADIAIFLNRALDHVNPEFFRELTSQARRHDCGIVTPAKAGTGVFAVKTALLAQAGGLSAIQHNSAEELCNRMAELSRNKGLKILRTPYAAANLRRETAASVPGSNRV